MVSTQQVSGQLTNGMVNPTMVRVTPEMATQWLESTQYEHQRSVRQRHVEFLAEEMRRGKFVQGTQIRFITFNSRRILVDGQHRLWAIVESGLPQYLTVLTTKSETEEEIAWIYGNTDSGMRRTGADLYGALNLEAEFGLSKMQIGALGATITYMASGCIRTTTHATVKHRDDAVRYMRLYASHARAYFDLTVECELRIGISLRRAATMSIGLLTLRFAQSIAEERGDPSVVEFWKGVVFDNGIQLGDARKLANRHLLNVRTISAAAHAYSGDVVTAGYSSRYLASCFNAYMTRRNLKMAKVLDAQAPLKMYGVPSDQARWFE